MSKRMSAIMLVFVLACSTALGGCGKAENTAGSNTETASTLNSKTTSSPETLSVATTGNGTEEQEAYIPVYYKTGDAELDQAIYLGITTEEELAAKDEIAYGKQLSELLNRMVKAVSEEKYEEYKSKYNLVKLNKKHFSRYDAMALVYMTAMDLGDEYSVITDWEPVWHKMNGGVVSDIENGLPLWNGQLYDNSFADETRPRGDGENCSAAEYIIYHAIGTFSRLNGEPLFETESGTGSLRLKDDITFEEMVRAVVRLYDVSESADVNEYLYLYAKEESLVKYGTGKQSVSTHSYPTDEYERAVWYGFIEDGTPEDLAGTMAVSWSEYIEMLNRMIEKYDPTALPKWKALAANPPTVQIGYDGASIALLYAAETIDLNIANTTSFAGHSKNMESCRGKEYPVFDYKAPVDYSLGYFLDNEADQDIKRLIVSADYSIARISVITHEPLLDWNWRPNDFLSYKEAAVSVVRLYESTDRIAYDTAEKILEEVLKTDEAKEILKKADERREYIRNTPTTIVHSDTFIQGETYTGKAYYVSNNGDDSNDGLSEATPFATVKRLENVKLKYGDAVFFERGSIWYNASLSRIIRTEGITISAYGTGEKPKFYNSYENSAGKEKWELYCETAEGGKIWKYYRTMPDVAVIVMNDGETYASRAIPFWTGTDYYPLSLKGLRAEPFDMAKDLKDMEFFPYLKYKNAKASGGGESSTALDTERVFISGRDKNGQDLYLEGELFLRCDAGNPGELYKEIQMSTPSSCVDGLRNYTTIDNICNKYASQGFAIGRNETGPASHVVVQNCEIGWMGGATFEYRTEPWYDVWRMGGANNVNGPYMTLRNNYTHHSYQEGTCIEIHETDDGLIENMTLEGNLTEYCTVGNQIINWDREVKANHIFKDVKFSDNMSLFAGFENLYNFIECGMTDHGSDGQHMEGYLSHDSHCFGALSGAGGNAYTGTFSVDNNLFAFSFGKLIEINYFSEKYSKIYHSNTYAQIPGFGWTSVYDAGDGLEIHPRELDPEKAVKEIGDTTATIVRFDK